VPQEVLACILEHLGLERVLVDGFPTVAAYAAAAAAGGGVGTDAVTRVGLELMPEDWDAGQTDTVGEMQRRCRHPLFEITCR
jgi:hypothetical protein